MIALLKVFGLVVDVIADALTCMGKRCSNPVDHFHFNHFES